MPEKLLQVRAVADLVDAVAAAEGANELEEAVGRPPGLLGLEFDRCSH